MRFHPNRSFAALLAGAVLAIIAAGSPVLARQAGPTDTIVAFAEEVTNDLRRIPLDLLDDLGAVDDMATGRELTGAAKDRLRTEERAAREWLREYTAASDPTARAAGEDAIKNVALVAGEASNDLEEVFEAWKAALRGEEPPGKVDPDSAYAGAASALGERTRMALEGLAADLPTQLEHPLLEPTAAQSSGLGAPSSALFVSRALAEGIGPTVPEPAVEGILGIPVLVETIGRALVSGGRAYLAPSALLLFYLMSLLWEHGRRRRRNRLLDMGRARHA